ncbi:MAG: energy-coupling factor ABC transporter ATP-binding protein [Methanosarcinales archaeon]
MNAKNIPIFELENVNYAYLNKFPALRDINLSINRGEQIVFLGSNGSGKSTLLKILNGLYFPSSGKIRAFGQPLTEEIMDGAGGEFTKYFREKVGFVFQDSDVQLFSPIVWDEIAFGPLQLDLPIDEVERRVMDVIEMLGIENLKDRAPYTLSGGEKKKVAIASVLSLNPDVLLLDEPTNGLDPRTQRWLVELMQELRNAGKTIITATHDLSIVEEIADRVIVLSEDHRIAADDTPDAILSNIDLLLSVNLIHEHTHKHYGIIHKHLHAHSADHEHKHAKIKKVIIGTKDKFEV